MKRLIILTLIGGSLIAQTPPTNYPINPQPLPVVNNIFANYSGTRGPTTVYYWIITKYAIGNSASSIPYPVTNITLGTGSVAIGWSAPSQPSTYNLTYDVLRTTTAQLPASGSCISCLVASATSTLSATDNLGALSNYTLNPAILNPRQIAINDINGDRSRIYDNRNNGASYSMENLSGPTLPTYCNNSDTFTLISGSSGLYFCLNGTWTKTSTGGGATISSTTNLIKGDGAGNGIDSTIVPSSVITNVAQIIAAFSGLCSSSTVLVGDGTCGTISSSFSTVTSGTNTAALLIGTGGSLGVSGSGTINATSVGTITGIAQLSSGVPTIATAHNLSSGHTCISASASSITYTCVTNPSFTPVTGDIIYFQADVANTAVNPTINVNSAGNKIVKIQALNVNSTTFSASGWYLLIYDGTFWELVSTPLYSQSTNGNFYVDSGALINNPGINALQAAGSSNVWQFMRPDQKAFGMMSDHQIIWRSVNTGSFFSGGATDTGISRIGPAAIGIGTGTQGTISGTIQSGVTVTDPGCTTTANIGKQWFDITTTSTVLKDCMNIAGVLTWVTK